MSERATNGKVTKALASTVASGVKITPTWNSPAPMGHQ
jgi:hypothetical protein